MSGRGRALPAGGSKLFGWRIVHYRRVASTQALARRLAARGAVEATVVVADVQSRGRGRLGRRWRSPKGGLWFSLVLRPPATGFRLGLLGLAAGLAVARALQAVCGLRAKLKWPNDVVVGDRKIAGVLSEAVFLGDALKYVVLGVGVNTNFARGRLPADLRETATTVQAELGRGVGNEQLLEWILARLEDLYEDLRVGRTRALLAKVRRRMRTIGRQVELALVDGAFSGVVKDVTDEGGVVLRLPDGSRRVVFPHEVLGLRELAQ